MKLTIDEAIDYTDAYCANQVGCERCILQGRCEDDDLFGERFLGNLQLICGEEVEIVGNKEIKDMLDDNVNHPTHYTQGNIECLDAMTSAFGAESVMNFCICNAFKYIWRHRYKHGIEDLEKAKFYINKFQELAKSIS